MALLFPSIKTPWLRKALALHRIEDFNAAFKEQYSIKLQSLSYFLVFLSIILALIPPIAYLPGVFKNSHATATVFTGIALCLAIILRNVAKLEFHSCESWKKAMSIIHTAFGIGCIPLVVLLVLDPGSLQKLPIVEEVSVSDRSQAFWNNLQFVLQVSLWAALTEEFIYRGLLVSFLRRMPVNISQKQKDWLAAILGGVIFGLAHIPTWGFALSFAVGGLGIGFGLGYIAIGERLIPLIVYHAIFDILSMCLTMLRL